MTWHIYSTLSANTQYVTYKTTDPKQLAVAEHKVMIKGGANVANRNIVTPRGVVTVVSDEDYSHLIKNTVFQQHIANHHIYCDQIKANPNKVADGNLEPKDESAPLTPDDEQFQNKKRGEGVKVRDDSKGKSGKK